MVMKTQFRCDACGKFISLEDLVEGKAQRIMESPDSYYSCETFLTLCKEHYERLKSDDQQKDAA